MAHNTPGEFAKMYSNRKAIEHLVQSSDAQALGEMLSQSHNGAELEKMAQNALSGDTAAIQSLMQSITQSKEGSELLRRLSESFDNN